MKHEETQPTPEQPPQPSMDDNSQGTKAEGLEETATPANDPEQAPTKAGSEQTLNPEKTIVSKETEKPAIQKFAETQQPLDINIELDREGKRVTVKRGRPALFTPETLQIKINEYFKECKENKTEKIDRNGNKTFENDPLIPTYAGLAYHIGIDRFTLWNYNKQMPFYDTIKKARDHITAQLENALINSKNNPVGKIFISKNYGYTDKQEIEVTKPLEIILTDYRGRKAQEIKPISETNE